MNYEKLIHRFSNIVKPMMDRTKKENSEWKALRWTEQHNMAFQKLKGVLTIPPVLANLNEDKEIVIPCDASRHGIGGMLSQYQEDGTLFVMEMYNSTLINMLRCHVNEDKKNWNKYVK